MKKIIIALVVMAFIGAAGIFFFFYRFFQNDVQTITGFVAAYTKYDQAIGAYSGVVLASNRSEAPALADLEKNTDEALVDLKTKAAARISSMTKNDAELMSLTGEIGDLSGKEWDALQAYRKAPAEKNGDQDRLVQEVADLTRQRQAAYDRFRELLGLKE